MLCSDESTFQLVSGKNGFRVLIPKDHPDFHQRQKQKQSYVMVYEYISANGMGDFHMCEGTIDIQAYMCWSYN